MAQLDDSDLPPGGQGDETLDVGQKPTQEFGVPDGVRHEAHGATEPISDELGPTVTGAGGAVGGRGRHTPKIAGYQITGVLGQGGMGIVYRAVQTKLNRTVALKVLPAVVGSANPTAVSRFRREATSAARLHHTNIVPIYDFGEVPDGSYYAMELIPGQPLNELIRTMQSQDATTASPVRLAELLRIDLASAGAGDHSAADSSSSGGSLSASGSSLSMRRRPYYYQVARWMSDAADALHYAHEQGVTHRDIKPANLILSENARIMVADFGLARTEGELSITMTGSFLGTLRYMSPEQAMAKRVRIDHRTDIYSLGATMYELLCFQPAFPGDDDKAVLGAVIARDPMAPRKVLPAVPPELETICLKALEKLPDARYSTARALSEDLRRFIQDLPIAAKRPGPIARARKFVRRHKAAVLAAAALTLLAVLVPLLMHGKSRESHRADAASLVALAQGFEKNGRWSDAASLYQEALGIEPTSIEALGNYARMKKEQFNTALRRRREADPVWLEEAVELCGRALAISPNHIATLNTMGVLLKKLGRFDEAIVYYERAVKLKPEYGPALENLGIVQALARDLYTAERNINQSADLTRAGEHQCEYPWRNLATLQLHRGEPAAVEHIERALACSPKNAATLRLRARLRLELGGYEDFKGALEDAGNAAFLDDKDPRSRRVYALALLRNGDFAKAVENAQKAIGLGDDLPSVDQFVIAIAEANLGHHQLAQEAFHEGNEAWPADLRDARSFHITADLGILWIESADRLYRFRDEAKSIIELNMP